MVGDATDHQPGPVLTPEQVAARLLGSKGGRIGGRARAEKLTAERRSDIAKRAAAARWKPGAKAASDQVQTPGDP
ncbi:MAG: hypothetical protein M3O87_01300 [Candidatus Dormibacteraeota bacterium]|nr:hypothetical protein [Candidatus Dormibacteraeota bacterium]